MIRQKEEYKAYWMLKNFTPGQLQAFVLVDTPFKSGRGDEAPVTVKPKRVQSTKIPASTIHRFQTGEYTPRERSIKKLSKFYDKFMYNKLRATGASKKDARTCRTMDPEKITPVLKDYRKWAKQIQKNYQSRYRQVTLSHILWGMAHSVKYGYNDWAMIAMTSGLKKRPQFKKPKQPKRRRQYEH
jgi:hypothetical protein